MHFCSGLCRHRLVRVDSARGRRRLGCRDRANPRPAGIGALAVATQGDIVAVAVSEHALASAVVPPVKR